MYQITVFIFILGWVIWFLIDKSPMALGFYLPPPNDELLKNFQYAFDLLKAGQLKAAFTFLWGAHYLVLTILFSIIFSILYGSIRDSVRRKKLRELYVPKSTDNE